MNIKLRYDYDFVAGVYNGNNLLLNNYNMSISLTTVSAENEINLAIQRMSVFMDSKFRNAIFIDEKHRERAKALYDLGCNIITLPSDPIDQIIGLALWCKYTAIVENRIEIDSLEICSRLGDNLWYVIEQGDQLGPFDLDVSNNNWWHRSDLTHADLDHGVGNVLHFDDMTWAVHNLEWPEQHSNKNDNNQQASVVYADFGKRDQ
jgi:hypothetical protein